MKNPVEIKIKKKFVSAERRGSKKIMLRNVGEIECKKVEYKRGTFNLFIANFFTT